MITIPNKNKQDAALLQWVKNFAVTNYHQVNFLRKNVKEIASKYFQNLQLSEDTDPEQLLNSLGILSAISLGDEKIAWSVAENRSQADAMIEQYNTPAYSSFRKAIGIDSHWILLVNPELMFTLQDLYEAHMDLLELEDKPECIIVSLL
ncbi:MAG: hypothetical protein HC820_04920 [Hydrococcus sp. RM1_1_31]|nr:hypothetical protein [Hydrococcus sp. RM1_1_31]